MKASSEEDEGKEICSGRSNRRLPRMKPYPFGRTQGVAF